MNFFILVLAKQERICYTVKSYILTEVPWNGKIFEYREGSQHHSGGGF